MKGFLRFGPRSWGSDDSPQHPLTPPPPCVKLPSPPTPKQAPPPAAAPGALLGAGGGSSPFPLQACLAPHPTLPKSGGEGCDSRARDTESSNDSARGRGSRAPRVQPQGSWRVKKAQRNRRDSRLRTALHDTQKELPTPEAGDPQPTPLTPGSPLMLRRLLLKCTFV
ncbi:unnamed protein product [Nyctereutes procyonoides]|uniref:(raccoon dog) hypothetical protein n=1 Tax=Nyctereutes procyonoides TaxID=34880 RepID=A0A811Z6W7_NYCPR|nr:unnamed protein product [Nyctereutes procyonoides]